ncbi:DNA-binding NarL/FixJ family response regulator [Rhodobium orientis]|uniref:DNA-binding response regulator n=1 Tax=Rhodobium orientis TaxID=34017 RepID=A0A327JKT8_9HYPH|nr:response regulator transcription factor [Rhodobium orientis]MBB4303171.1 DNA-binding NarL/FixJ family response regulator [Rhodobium orientis]MBK5951728.1 DNA-binding response regulator [Rhodobium orientis]RAI26907.1 DNA-binding response regulator [Rhodobium orientis]
MHILIADDHELVRDTICAFLEREGDVRVSTASDFGEAIAKIDTEGPYDLVILDYNMPGMEGLESLAHAKDRNMGNPVGIISGTANRSVAEEALAAGAAGFLPKTLAAKSLIHAVRFMAAGEQYAPIDFMRAQDGDDDNPLAPKLSKRESEVLKGLMRGASNKEIARELDLQEVTVKLHVKTLCRKLDARNRTQAAMIAKDAGMC